MSDEQYFHFTLAPVQGFIAQARRTRDFWTGSFILSWLSAVAMNAVVKQGGSIIFPCVDEAFLTNLLEGGNEEKSEHGGVPNRFKAKVSKGFEPETVVASVQKAWKTLADKVYKGDLEKFANPKTEETRGTKEIWNEQVENFWDMTWVLTTDKTNSAALDVRKNWRSYLPPEQAGVKCMVMEGWQELSGEKKSGEEVRTFWQKIRNNPKVKGMKTDLREGEQLCAIAFIKRRFPRYFGQVDVVMTGSLLMKEWTLKGWDVKAGKPSVAYMAAVHWLEQVLKIAENNTKVSYQLRGFRYKAYRLTKGQYNEWDNQIECLKPFDKHKKWLSLDGNVFFEAALENANIYEDQEQAKAVLGELKKLQQLVKQVKPDFQPVSPFYAVLIMDGDSLGKQMSDIAKQETISQGLKDFTESVPSLLQKHNGFLIYAGADDVLAVLPLEDALRCALAIRQKYECVFADLNLKQAENAKVFTSISAAVLFAHINMPLKNVLKTAHQLLDNVAKDQYGRDSLAVSVWKQGGWVLEWARPWNKAIENKQLVIERLATQLATDDESRQFSNRFLYKIRERFELLNPKKDKKDPTKRLPPVLSDTQAIDLMAAEYLSSGLCDVLKIDERKATHTEKISHAKAMVTPLLEQCRPIYRKLNGENNQVSFHSGDDVLVDAALLIRFLAQHGVNL